MLIPQWYPMSFTKIGHYSLVHVGLWDFFNCRYWPRLPGSELLFCIPDRYCNYKMPIAYVCSCSFFRKQVATVWDIFSHFFRGGESMWVVFFRDSETWKFEVLEVVRQLYTKKTSGVPSVSTGNRKTPSRSLSQKNLTYTKLLDEAWHCLAVCMSTCRMETKTVDALYLVWFKQCDLYDLENEHQCGATYFYYTSKEQETEELEKSQQKNALRFNGMWNQPPPKKNVFFSTFQTFVVYRENGYPFFICITEHSPVSKKKKKNFPDSSDALLPQQDGRQRPHDGHGEQGSQDFRLVESWKNVGASCCRAVWPFQAMFLCVLWGFKRWREGKLMQTNQNAGHQKFKEHFQ